MGQLNIVKKVPPHKHDEMPAVKDDWGTGTTFTCSCGSIWDLSFDAHQQPWWRERPKVRNIIREQWKDTDRFNYPA